MAGFAASFWMGSALSEEVPEQLHAAQMVIRAILLSTPEWAWEQERSQDHADPTGSLGKLDRGKARFAEKDGKLIGHVDKCDSEVVLRPDGFDMAKCSDGEKRFVRSGDEFKATFGSYIYTLRPAP
jgi:hypothetical protein